MSSPPLYLSACALPILLAGCGQPDEPNEPPVARVDNPSPPGALWEKVDEFKADMESPRHPSDGGGSVFFGPDREPAPALVAGTRHSFDLRYLVGPLGIAEGGSVHFMPEPFWGWSVPQTSAQERLGFTRVSTAAEGVELDTSTVGGFQTGYLVVRVRGRAMEEGEELRFEYGAGSALAAVDRHAGRGARLWFYVDGDGDGIRGLVSGSPAVDVAAAPPARLVATAPSVVRPGATLRLGVAVLDAWANDDVEFSGEIRIHNRPEGWGIPETITLAPEDRGRKQLELIARSPGVLRLGVRAELSGQEVTVEANPTWVDEQAPLVYWGDLHGHSGYSDGTGLPADWFRYARDTAGLDFASLTDHDHFGVQFLDAHPDMWEDIRQQVISYHAPGRFVTVLGYEWTSWIHGHRHVLFFADEGPLLSSLDERYETPRQLWARLRSEPALTLAHHSAGDPIPTNWTFRPDPEVEPVTEIMSVHGSSEARDSPRLLRRPREGNFVRDVLEDGVQLGFIGSGDSHDGHPGLAHLSPVYGWLPPRSDSDLERPGTGGLAGVMAQELSRDGLLQALKARRCYATSGPRIYLRVTLDGHEMGETIDAEDLLETPTLRVVALGTAPLSQLDLVRGGVVESLVLEGDSRKLIFDLPLPPLERGDYVYLRLHQVDDTLAWSSPFFIR